MNTLKPVVLRAALAAMLAAWSRFAWADTQGPNNPTGASDVTYQDTAWSNPGFVTDLNANDATVTLGNNKISHYLMATGFSFSVPAGASITGIVVALNRKAGNANTIYDDTVQLATNGLLAGANRAATSTAWPTAYTSASYGASTDMWGVASLQVSDVNSPRFGVRVAAKSTSNNRTAYLDNIRVTVYYAPPVAPVVTNTAPPDVSTNSAKLYGQVTAGLPTPGVWVYWGSSDRTTNTAAWDTNTFVTVTNGTFNYTLTNLLANQAYWYRWYATNAAGTNWSTPSTAFTTALAKVQFAAATAQGSESLTSTNLLVTLSAATGTNVTFQYGVLAGGTATGGGVDYTLVSGTATIAVGNTSATIPLAVVDDLLYEGNEDLTVAISNVVGATLASPSTHTYTITNNDAAPTVSFAPTAYTVQETDGVANLSVSLAAMAGVDVGVQYLTSNGTALAGSDYTATTGTVVWAAGESGSKSFSVPVLDDAAYETDEVFRVTLTALSNCTVVTAASTATVTIAANDWVTPTVDTDGGATPVGTNTATLNGTLTAGNPAPSVWIYFDTVDEGTNSKSAWATNYAFGAKTPTAAFTTNLTGLLANQGYVYRCYASNAYGEAWSAAATFTTLKPKVQFAAASASGAESVTSTNFALTLSHPAGSSVTVACQITGGTATEGVDCSLAGSSVTIPAGLTTTSLTLNVVNDGVHESNETVVVTLSSPAGADLGPTVACTYTINDDDAAEVFFTNTPYAVSETSGAVRVAVGLSTPAAMDVSVSWQTADGSAQSPGDYAAGSGTLLWTPGDTSVKTVGVVIVDDGAWETNESFTVALSGAVDCTIRAPTQVTVTIADDDGRAPAIDNDGGATSVSANTATLNGTVTAGNPTPSVWVYYGTNDGGTAKASWKTNAYLGVQGGAFATNIAGLTANRAYWYRCYASNAVSNAWAAQSATFTTLLPTVQFALSESSGSETLATTNLQITLSSAAGANVTVGFAVTGGTASNGADYVLTSDTATVTVGNVSASIPFTVIDDGVLESNETVVVTLFAPGGATLGAPSVHTYTILDDELGIPNVYFVNLPGSVPEGVGTVQLEVESQPGAAGDVYYSTSDGTALAGSDYTAKIPTKLHWPDKVYAQSRFTSIAVVNDVRDEPGPNECFYVTLSDPVNCAISPPVTVPVYIVDDDERPTVDNAEPSTVTVYRATLCGNLVSRGFTNNVAAPTTVTVYWGPDDRGTNAAAWSNRITVANVPTGVFGVDITNLVRNARYYYRCYATNAAGEHWAAATTNFLVTPNFGVDIFPQSDDVVLNIRTVPGCSYVIEAADTAPTGGWEVVFSTNNATGPIRYVDATLVGPSASSRFYRITEADHGTWGTNVTLYAAYTQPTATGAWYRLAMPIDTGASNRLDSTLGQQAARGLAANNAWGDLLYVEDASGAWVGCVLGSNNQWRSLVDGSVVTAAVDATQGYWIKRRSEGSNSVAVYTGPVRHGTYVQAFRSNDWHLISWPFATPRRQADYTNAVGWGFAAGGAKPGTTWMSADLLMTGAGTSAVSLWLNTNGVWCRGGEKTPADDVRLEAGEGIYYYHRGTGFTWTVREE